MPQNTDLAKNKKSTAKATARQKKEQRKADLAAARQERAKNRAATKQKKDKRRAAAYDYDGRKKRPHKPLTYIELSYFCGQMALILKAGISSIEGIAMMEDDYSSRQDRDILIDIREEMAVTGELYSSLAKTGVFPNYMINMVRIGEETGNLDDVMRALEEHYAREEQLRSSIQSAIFYPLIMSGMIIAVITVLLVRVMPIFNQVFRQLGTEMTGFAALLMNIGDIISRYALILVLILAIVIVFALFCVKTTPGRKLSHSLLRNIKSFRILNDQIASCRFADGMALILRSGLAPDRGFDLVRDLNEDADFEKKLAKCHKCMIAGDSLSEALKNADIFSGVYSRLTSIGSKTGSLDGVMSQIATLYQDEIDTKISNRLAVLEPALIVILSFVVGAILISVMFPLLGIMATI